MADDFNILDVGFTFTDPALEASADAIEASVASIDTDIDVALSTRASEATLATRASEATVASIDGTLTSQLDVALSTRASEATLATRASEATLAAAAADIATIETNTNNLDVALSTRASEATLATRASEATVASIDGTLTSQLDVALSTRASEATLGTVATNTGNTTTQVTTLNTNFGAQADAAATTDTGTFSLMAFVKRLLSHLTDIKANERNSSATVIASAAFTATQTSVDQTNLSAQGAHIIWSITANSGGFNVTPTIQAFDVASSTWYDLLVGDSQNSLGTYVLKVHPGLPGVAKKTAADGLPLTWRIRLVHGNANSVTYSVGVNYLE